MSVEKTNMAPAEKVYTVSQLSASIRNNLRSNNAKLEGVWIEGEIMGWKPYSSGHAYFFMKDNLALINCAMYHAAKVPADEAFKREFKKKGIKQGGLDGVKIQVQCELDTDVSKSGYSAKIRKVRISGEGERMAQYYALLEKLTAEGLIKQNYPERQRKLPKFPKRIGIVTSPSGAVIHDMCRTMIRRYPNIEIRLFPSKVQGEDAPRELIQGINYFNSRNEKDWLADVIIIGRGGGSKEDLWCFNDEELVRTIAVSKIPVVSAVGHENDFTICDYVADVRAGTPSNAAEMVTRVEKSKILEHLADTHKRIVYALQQVGEMYAKRVDTIEDKLVNSLKQSSMSAQLRLNRAVSKLAPLLSCSLSSADMRLQQAVMKLLPSLKQSMMAKSARFDNAIAKLKLLDPNQPLQRGYSITMNSSGKVVRSADDVKSGDTITTHLGKGELKSVVSSAS